MTFLTFLVYVLALSSGNPANEISVLLQGKTDEVARLLASRIWAAKLLSLRTSYWVQSVHIFSSVRAWAFCESLNNGSHQRSKLPEEIASIGDLIKGSGRWNASDQGGHWKCLRDAVLGFTAEKAEQAKNLNQLLCDLNRWLVIDDAVPQALVLHARFQRADGLAREIVSHYPWDSDPENRKTNVRSLRTFLLSRGEEAFPSSYVDHVYKYWPPAENCRESLDSYLNAEFPPDPALHQPLAN